MERMGEVLSLFFSGVDAISHRSEILVPCVQAF